MPVDKVYLQSIRELEAEKNVVFPEHIINAFSEKTWISTDYHIYVDQCYYAAHSVEGSEIYRYNFFKNYSWPEVKVSTKKELYKACIPVPRKCSIHISPETEEEHYVKIDDDGEYWCWELGINKSWFGPILCLYNESRIRHFDALYSRDDKGIYEYELDEEFSFDLSNRDERKPLWDDDEADFFKKNKFVQNKGGYWKILY